MIKKLKDQLRFKRDIVTPKDHFQRFTILAIRLFLVGAVIWQAQLGRTGQVFAIIVLLLITYVPHLFFERRFKLTLPIEFHFVITIFLFCCIYTGTVTGAYWYVPWWDNAMHAVSGIMFGFFGFLILYTLYEQKRLAMSLKIMALFAFCFSMASGAMWEIAEFTGDTLFKGIAQRNNTDTMEDLVFDAIGAIIIAVAGYRYIKNGRGYLHRFVQSFKHHNPQLYPARQRSGPRSS